MRPMGAVRVLCYHQLGGFLCYVATGLVIDYRKIALLSDAVVNLDSYWDNYLLKIARGYVSSGLAGHR